MKLTKVAAIITSYNDAEAVLRCVHALKHQVDSITIVDNGSDAEHIPILQSLRTDESVTVIESPVNLGVGAALNLALRSLDIAGIEWVLTMDQDSVVAPDMVYRMLEAASCYPKASFTPDISQRERSDGSSAPIEVGYAITSGNLVPIAALKILNGLSPTLFIDGVDFDFSLRLRGAGYRIFRVPGARMLHFLGRVDPGKKPRRFHTIHSPLRRYYMTRNFILNLRLHGLRFPGFFFRLYVVFFISFMNLLIFGPKRFESLRMTFRGLLDGALNRSGAYNRD